MDSYILKENRRNVLLGAYRHFRVMHRDRLPRWTLSPPTYDVDAGEYEMAGGCSGKNRDYVHFIITVDEEGSYIVNGTALESQLGGYAGMLIPTECVTLMDLYAHLNKITAFIGGAENFSGVDAALNAFYKRRTDSALQLGRAHRRRTSWPTWRSLWAAAAWIWRQCTRA